MESKLTELEKQIEKNVEKRISEEIQPIIKLIEKSFLSELKIDEFNLLSCVRDNNVGDFLLCRDELNTNYDNLLQKRRKQLLYEETQKILNKKDDVKEVKSDEVKEKTKIDLIIEYLNKEKQDKLKQIQYMNDFLLKTYKGNDSKQKVEKELITLNNEYSVYTKIFNFISNNDNLPF